jgi:tetratricopeptide (TPR) repeat protein
MHPNYTEEIETLKQRLDENPESMLFARLAERYLQLDKIDQAIDICRQGLDRHPDYASGHFVLAKCFFAQQQYDEAERGLKKAITIDPKFLKAHKLYGDLMTRIGWNKSSETSYRKILEFDPLDEVTRNLLSSIPKGEPTLEVEIPLLEPEAAPAREVPDIIQKMEKELAANPLFEETEKSESEDKVEEPAPKEAPLSQSFFEDDNFVSSPIEEEELIQDLEERTDAAVATEGFEQEEMRFSEILDDLFSASILEEERREAQARNAIEKAAEREAGFYETEELEAARELIREDAKDAPITEEDPQAFAETDLLRAEASLPEISEEKIAPQETDYLARPVEAFEDKASEQAQMEPLEQEIEDEQDKTDFTKIADLPFSEKESFAAVDDDESFELADLDSIPEMEIEEQEANFSQFLSKFEEEESSNHENHSDEGAVEEQDQPESLQATEEEPPLQSKLEAEDDDMMQGTQVDLKPKEKFVTPTLGEIYAAQGQYAKAINVFELLLKKHPDNDWYRTKLDYLRKRLSEEEN